MKESKSIFTRVLKMNEILFFTYSYVLPTAISSLSAQVNFSADKLKVWSVTVKFTATQREQFINILGFGNGITSLELSPVFTTHSPVQYTVS